MCENVESVQKYWENTSSLDVALPNMHTYVYVCTHTHTHSCKLMQTELPSPGQGNKNSWNNDAANVISSAVD